MNINWKEVTEFAKFGAMLGLLWAVVLVLLGAFIGNLVSNTTFAMMAVGGAATGASIGLMAGLMVIVFSAIFWWLTGLSLQFTKLEGFWPVVLSYVGISTLVSLVMGGVSLIGVVVSLVSTAVQAYVGIWLYKKLKWRSPI